MPLRKSENSENMMKNVKTPQNSHAVYVVDIVIHQYSSNIVHICSSVEIHIQMHIRVMDARSYLRMLRSSEGCNAGSIHKIAVV